MAGLAAKLSAQDSKDLEKYLRYFVYKSAQVIIQSRVGERLNVPSKQFATGADWFNLTVRDDADVLSEVKRVYPGPGGGLLGGDIICIETLLRTYSGDALPLETWWIKLVPPCDLAARVSFTVYNRIGLLLKSLLIASRSIPAYRLSRRFSVSGGGYSIYYRIYIGAPTFDLGTMYCTHTVGTVPTPVGTVQLLLAYRTQIMICPAHQQAGPNLELRDDHFQADSSVASAPVLGTCWRVLSRCGQTVGDNVQTKNASPLSSSPPDHNRMVSIPSGLSRLDEEIAVRTSENRPKVAAFGGSPFVPLQPDVNAESSVPFGSLLEWNPKPNHAEESPGKSPSDAVGCVEPMVLATSSSTVSDREAHNLTHTDDFVMLDMKLPFAGACSLDAGHDNRGEGDLGHFYRECQSAPALSMFQQSSTNIRELMNSITDQLAQFEANAKDFDEFVSSFQES